ncbi:glyoxylate/hydroxypyruvate reductase A-like [Asterias amurensis]|uniref:glyoxylate/hydroxypyruvate reductase A-like n=1 Tax=Asterias amurensis TaxID=7602 RepID=UPI003AB319ED
MASVDGNGTVMDGQALSRNRPVVVIYTAYNDTVIQQLKERHSDIPYVLVDVQPPGEIIKAEVLAILQEAEIILSDTNLIPPIYTKLKKTKWIQSTWAGIDGFYKHLDFNELPTFTFTRFGQGIRASMAEYTIGHIIAHERSFFDLKSNQEQKIWKQIKYRSLDQITIGILGAGDIGEEIARVCKAFNMTTWGLVRRDLPKEERSEHVDVYKKMDGLCDLLAECDYICSVLPQTPQTDDILSNDVLSNCTKKPMIINIGRGNIISEDAILKALEKGWISHAVLDVFREEPLPKDSPLWSSSKVTISPHSAGHTFSSKLITLLEENYDRYINGKPLKFIVDWKQGY